ncbi:MAG: NAD(P)-dependent alcohol dehydrogenase [Calditrichaeota bacterium]|nr:MAG: NAD(P)-dependent alcohol dehydrogenase [Calditrichota bacterium]MBL1206206.1 NAD(P)-dependent alcohol dehydrogenase [Calditrichota bacterium]NOG46031.1 NAD(P)-dependent alcohol dehydrogenase [Calditrichota bacterium]
MKAVVYKKYGSPDVLHVKEIKKPTPKDDEILFKVNAAEVTKADCELRSFNFPVKWFWLPMRLALGITKPRKQILGGYFSGEVEATGKNVSKFKIGDQVFGNTGFAFGAHGEYVCLPLSTTLVHKPNNLSFEEAAAVPLGGLNALHFMRKANIQKGEKVLINGAGGSIGIFAVQIAKEMGAEVTAVDSTIKEKMLRELGVDHFIDYTKEEFLKSGQSYDVIFNMVANCSYSACIKALNPKGRYVMGNPRVSNMFRSILTSKFTNKTSIFAFAGEKEEELQTLKEMIEEGKIKSIVDRVYSFEQAAEAHRRVETEQRIGPVIISADS